MARMILTLLVVIFTHSVLPQEAITRIDVPYYIDDAVVDGERKQVFVKNGGVRLDLVSLETGSILPLQIPHSLGPMTVTPNGSKIYIASAGPQNLSTGAVTEINVADGKITRTIKLPFTPLDMAATDSGLLVAFGRTEAGAEIAVFNGANGAKISGRTTIFFSEMKLILHPSQKFLYGATDQSALSEFKHYKLSDAGEIIDSWDSPYHYELTFGHGGFIYPDGSKLLTENGIVLTSSADQATDLRYSQQFDLGLIRSAIFNTNNLLVISTLDSLIYFDYLRQEIIGTHNAGPQLLGFYGDQVVAAGGQSILLYRLPARNAEENRPPTVSIEAILSSDRTAGSKQMISVSAFDQDGGIKLLKLFSGTNEIAAATNSAAVFNVTLGPGTNEYFAIASDYFGATATSALTRIVAEVRPTLEITAPVASFYASFPTELVVVVSASDPDGLIRQGVSLYANGKFLGSDDNAPYEFRFRPELHGTYELIAYAWDHRGAMVRSATRVLESSGPSDHFGTHLTIVGSTNVNFIASTVQATMEMGEPQHAGVAGGKSLWFAWVSGGGVAVIDTFGSDFDTVLAVYTGSPGATNDITKLIPVASNDDDPSMGPASSVKFYSTSGVTYYIAVDGRDGVAGTVKLHVNLARMRPPTNDNLASFANHRLQEVGAVEVSSAGATKESGEPEHVNNPGGASIWWSFRPTFRTVARLTTRGSRFDTLLAVYTTNNVGFKTNPPTVRDLVLVASNDDRATGDRTSELTFVATPPLTYFVAVDGYDGASGQVRLVLSTDYSSFPNDFFHSAAVLSGASVLTNGTTILASLEKGEPVHTGKTNSASMWYRWTAPTNGPVLISTKTSDFDTVLAVYTGDALTNLTEVASNDDDPANRPSSSVIIYGTAGVEYKIVVAGYENARGEFALTVNQTANVQPRLYSQWRDGKLWVEIGPTDDPMVLESSTDLIKWEVAQVINPEDGAIAVVSEMSGQMRFYRLRQDFPAAR
jgi:hypothetical protein